MVAHTVAAAHCSPSQCFIYLFGSYILHLSYLFVHCQYCKHSLHPPGPYRQHQPSVSSVFHRTHNIADYIAPQPGSPWIVVGSRRRRRRGKERKQRRGRRSAVMLRLRRRPHKEPLPSPIRMSWKHNSREIAMFVTAVP